MGNPHAARIDADSIDSVAAHFDDSADLIEHAARSRLVFDGATAGRAYTAHGGEVRRSSDLLLADLSLWSRAATEIATALRAAALRYREAENSAAAGLS